MPIFCRNTGGLMENHGLPTHSDKMYAKSSTGNYPKYFTIHSTHLPKPANYLGYF